MYISKFKINNYKSYLNSTEVKLGPGINIVTGKNNAGKTALLQMLSLQFQNVPHKSTITIPNFLQQINPNSIIDIQFDLGKVELEDYIINLPNRFTLPDGGIHQQHYEGRKFFENYLKSENKFNVVYTQNGGIKSASLEGFAASSNNYIFNINKTNNSLNFGGRSLHANQDSFQEIAALLKQRVYFFHAERFGISSFRFGNNENLNPNAENLPEVLAILQGQKNRFKRYLDYVKVIFPQIHDISTRPNPSNNGETEIVVWNESMLLERHDLVVPLSQCGTGLGQVLAILYVVLTSDISKVIIIDEPNSFLHPGACRKLIEILKAHPQHQFIIATHSPSTIAAANPKTINIVRSDNAQSYIEPIDMEETNKQQLYLAEIGSKLSDVFGADSILWVEGKTEEICFPKIIEKTDYLSMMGTTILGVKNTGDFNGDRAELVFDIYQKLSVGKGLMPAAVGFIFDKEELTERKLKDLERKSNGKVKFISRRLYENYLLNPVAIFEVLKKIEIDEVEVKQEQIKDWIEKNKWDNKYIAQEYKKEKHDKIWFEKVDGAKFLTDLFSSITKKKVFYDKIKHSVALTEWILENAIEDFKELQELLAKCLNQKIESIARVVAVD